MNVTETVLMQLLAEVTSTTATPEMKVEIHPVTYTLVALRSFSGRTHLGFARTFSSFFHTPVFPEILLLALIIISLVGILGNIAVIIVVFKNSSLRTITYLYLSNLAVADMILCLTLPLFAGMYYNNMDWKYGQFMCKFSRFITKQNLYASVGLLSGLSIDRALAVVLAKARGRTIGSNLGNTHQSLFSFLFANTSVMLSIFSIWTLSILFALPELIYSETGIANSVTLCVFSLPADSQEQFNLRMGIYEIFVLLFSFLIPVLVLTVCYSLIIATVKSRMIGNTDNKKRAILLAARVVVVFFICNLPLQCLKLYSILYGRFKLFTSDMSEHEKSVFHNLYTCSMIFAYSNSAINPFIYGFGNTATKKAFFELLGFNFVPRAKQVKRDYQEVEQKRQRYAQSSMTSSSLKNGRFGSGKKSNEDIYSRNGNLVGVVLGILTVV